jgi:DNA-binding XRE family transcriptional regulator
MTGKQVKELREGFRLTQAKLAAMIGVARVTVSRWESGTAAISPLAARLLELVDSGVLEECECEDCHHLMARHFINYSARGCFDCGDNPQGRPGLGLCYIPRITHGV